MTSPTTGMPNEEEQDKMTVSLAKGEAVALPTEADLGSPTDIWVGLGWDPADPEVLAADLDLEAFVVGADGHVLSSQHFIYYNPDHASDPAGAVVYTCDDRDGSRTDGGDDEGILIRAALLPEDAERVVLSVSIFDGMKRGQDFSQVRNPHVRLLNRDKDEVFAEFFLDEDMPASTCAILGEFVRDKSGWWQFRALGEPTEGGLAGLVESFGLRVID